LGIISPVEGRLVFVDDKLRGNDASEFVGVFNVNGISKLNDVSIRRRGDRRSGRALVRLPSLGVYEQKPNETRKRRRARCEGLLLFGR
jgi:hypothetical protein